MSAPSLTVVGAPGGAVGRLILDIRFQKHVATLHIKGPRPIYEFLREISAHYGCEDYIHRRVQAYAAMDDAALELVSARNFPATSLYEVR